jgi:hypothetical protein
MRTSPGSVKSRWATTVLGALLLAEGAGKLADPRGYVDALAAFRFFPTDLLWSAGVVWLTAELICGTALLVAGLARNPPRGVSLGGAIGALLLSIGYATLAFSAWFRGLQIANCTCFGVYLKQRLSLFVLAQELYMLAYTSWQVVKISRWATHHPRAPHAAAT